MAAIIPPRRRHEPMTASLLPTASVVIATYNRPEYVRTCLEHLSEQTHPPIQIIVVDSSPDERTLDVIEDFQGVSYLRNNLGIGHTATSRAIGMASAKGDVVAFIDDDAFAEPAWLEEILNRYTEPDVGAVGGRARNDQPGEESEGLDRIGLLRPDGTLTGNFAADPRRDVEVDHLLGANMSVRRSAVELVGGIHDHFPGTCLREETDIVLRLARAGYRVLYTPEAVVLHVGGTYAKGRRFDARYQYYAARNHVVLLVHALGPGDPRTRRYFWTVATHVGSELAAAVRAPFEHSRPTLGRKSRGVAGGLSRAVVHVAGTAAGTFAAAQLLASGDRPTAATRA